VVGVGPLQLKKGGAWRGGVGGDATLIPAQRRAPAVKPGQEARRAGGGSVSLEEGRGRGRERKGAQRQRQHLLLRAEGE
jgi:hypothetical protein